MAAADGADGENLSTAGASERQLEDNILRLLRQAGNKQEQVLHEAVATADDQAKVLGVSEAAVSKNLFLRDKKKRLFLITAASSTKVDLKVLSARLGCGKGNLRWATESELEESLQVSRGCVTPLALASTSSERVVLVLDKILNTLESFYVHLSGNRSSISITAVQLNGFLRLIGREPIYVDLELDPKIDKDNPPDLKCLTDQVTAIRASKGPSNGERAQTSKHEAPAAAESKGKGRSEAGTKPSSNISGPAIQTKAPQRGARGRSQDALDSDRITEEVLQRVSDILLGKKYEEVGIDQYVSARLRQEIFRDLNSFKNLAYAAGYKAGKGEIIAFAEGRYV